MSVCPLCGSEKTSRVSSRDRLGRRARTHLCEDCGLVFNDPLPDRAALIEAYVEDCERQRGPTGPDLGHTVRVLARFERGMTEYWPFLGKHHRLLDVCAGSGEFTYLLKELGFEVTALDPSAGCAELCRQRLGLAVEVADFADKDYPDGAFDVVRVHHVLVHHADVVSLLAKVRRWLSEDGLLYIEAPNIEAESGVRIRGELFDLGHAVEFNPVTLRKALAAAGFAEVEATRGRHGGSTAGFFQKSEPKPVERDPANARRVSDAITRHFARSRLGTFTQAVSRFAARVADRPQTIPATDHRAAADYFASRLKARLQRPG